MLLHSGVVRCLTVVLMLSSVGCLSSVRVSTKANDGIPFYVRRVEHVQHTIRDLPWLQVALSASPVRMTKPDGEELLGASTTRYRNVPSTPDGRAAIAKLIQDVASMQAVIDRSRACGIFKTVDSDFRQLPEATIDNIAASDGSQLRVTSNFIERVSFVDYSKTYYLNGKVPWFGSSSLSAELSDAGTLSKGANATTGGAAEAITAIAGAATGLFPLKELFSAKFVPPAPDNDQKTVLLNAIPTEDPCAESRNPLPLRVTVEVTPQAYIVEFVARVDTSVLSAAPLPVDFTKGSFTITPRTTSGGKSADAGISFSGQVTLPPVKPPKP